MPVAQPRPDTIDDAPVDDAPVMAQWRDVTVRYPYAAENTIGAAGPLSLCFYKGERLLLLGPSGCGKSTLLQTLTGIIPQSVPAEVQGAISLLEQDVASRSPSSWSDTVAVFFQDPEQTLCGISVEDEIAFALENRAESVVRMAERVTSVMDDVGLPDAWRPRRTATLSGGEKQMVALAAALSPDAPLFVADEPTAALAPAVAARVYDLLFRRGGPETVLIVDHRLDGMISAVDRVAVMNDAGALIAIGPPETIFRSHGDELDRLGVWTPLFSRLDRALAAGGVRSIPPPRGLADLLNAVDGLPAHAQGHAIAVATRWAGDHVVRPASVIQSGAAPVARLTNADCAALFGPVVVRNISVSIHAGEVLGILGANGAGKSTLAGCLAGLVRLRSGKRDGAAGGMSFQNPESQFTQPTALAEVEAVLGRDVEKNDRTRRALQVLGDWGLASVANRHPFELSQGQKRRLALAALTANDRWPLIILDEPTAGLDARGAETIARHIRRLAAGGRAIAVVTHEMDFALDVCSRSVVLAPEGVLTTAGVLAEGVTHDLLSDGELMRRAGLERPAIMALLDWLDTKGADDADTSGEAAVMGGHPW